MKRTILFLCFFLIFAALAAGCGSNNAITTGAFEGQTYSNDFFGLSLRVPDGWHIARKDEIQDQFGVPQAFVGADDKAIEETLNLNEQRTLYLLYVSEFPRDHTGSFNTNVSLVCENLKLAGLDIKSPKDYLLSAVQLLDKNALSLQPGEIDEEKIGNTKVASVYCELDLNGIPLRQRHFAAIKNGYAVLLTLTYSRDASVEEINQIQGIADSLMFK